MIMKWVTVEKSPIWPMFAVDTYFVTLMSVAVPMLNETCIDTALQNTGPSQHTPSGKTTNNRSCMTLNLFVQNTCSYTPHGVGSALFCLHGKDMQHQSPLYENVQTGRSRGCYKKRPCFCPMESNRTHSEAVMVGRPDQ